MKLNLHTTHYTVPAGPCFILILSSPDPAKLMGPVTATGQGSFIEPWYWRGKKARKRPGHGRQTAVSNKENNSTGASIRLE